MKIFCDINRNPNRNLPACGAVPQPSALRRDKLYIRERNLSIVQPKYALLFSHVLPLPCSHVLPLPCSLVLPLPTVLLSIPPFRIPTPHSLRIHINTIVHSTHFPSNSCLRFRFSSSTFVCLFLMSCLPHC